MLLAFLADVEDKFRWVRGALSHMWQMIHISKDGYVDMCNKCVCVADQVQLRCNAPSVPCANTSDKAFDYCEHGICCHNKELQSEFCASVSLS